MRFFDTVGPCDPERHYVLPPEPRLPDARGLIARSQYFAVHAPQQTGKTTTLAALARTLTAEGRYAALHFSCETAEVAREDYGAAQQAVLTSIAAQAKSDLPAELRPPSPWPSEIAETRLVSSLTEWAMQCPRPIVLIFDDVDAIQGNSLRSVLSQLRMGHTYRPAAFPASVVLCGLRDVSADSVMSGGDPGRLETIVPFNVKAETLRIGDFTADEVAELYEQRTAETGQPFTEEAVERAFEYTRGQPWLVNALAYEVIEEMSVEPPTPITVGHVDEAKERLILARATHLDSLTARLYEPRVRRVIEPLLAGGLAEQDVTYNDDVAYLRDLGLVAAKKPVAVANPIYREVIARVLGAQTEENIVVDPRSFILADGRQDFGRLLEEFAAFWREHGEVLVRGAAYHEVAPQITMMAFLQRVVNGGGYIDREYGVGRGRIDLLVRWPYSGADGKRAVQREAVELKVWRDGRPDPAGAGLEQLGGVPGPAGAGPRHAGGVRPA